MVNYKYTAISKSGQRVSGIVEGYNEYDAVQRIKQSCDVVLKVTEVNGEKGLLNMDVGKKLNVKAFSLMCSQFSIILASGIPIARTVELVAEKTKDKTLRSILNKVASDVNAGRTLAASFEDNGGDILPSTFVETIRSGEESGNLDKSFDSVYRHYDKQIKMKNKVRSALAYPAFVLFIAVVVVIVLMVKVVPTFTAIFDTYNAKLPPMTLALIAISNFFKKYIFAMIAVVAAVIIAYKIYSYTEKGRINLAKLALVLPIFGNINTLNAASQFSNSMTTMLGAGLPMTKAITISAKTIQNYYVSQEIADLNAKLEEGSGLAESMRIQNVMPDILTEMIGVGEETGELHETLTTISAYYDAELDMAVSSAMRKLEPAILIGLCLIAGFIVIAIYVAMFEMYGAM